MTMLKAGQSLLLNNRLWTLRQVRILKGRNLKLEVIGASDASRGMLRQRQAIRYGEQLFILQRRGGYWQANLQHSWTTSDYGPVLSCQQAPLLDLLNVHTQHPASTNLKNQFSWSFSRGVIYRRCPRAYYYHYYASWEGWHKESPIPVQKAYLLKNLTDVFRWSGVLVHQSIKFALARLKADQIINTPDLINQMRRRAHADIENSQQGRYQQQPKKYTGFQEHYYQEKLPKNIWLNALSKAERHLKTFINSPFYARLRTQSPATFFNVEELQSFELDETKVWVQIDMARYDNGVIYLYDWKTGHVDETEVQRQLGIYGLFARHTWLQQATKPLKGIVYSLAEDKLLEFELNESVLNLTKDAVVANINQLKKLLIGSPDENLAEMRRFPMSEAGSECQTCRFRELCGRN